METKHIFINSEYTCFLSKLIERGDYYILFAVLILEVTLALKTSVSSDTMKLIFIFFIKQLSIKNLFEKFSY